MDPDLRIESRATRVLRTLGYIYSIAVFVGATALAAQYHLGYMDAEEREPANAGASDVGDSRKPAGTNKSNLPSRDQKSPVRPAKTNAPSAISGERARAPSWLPARPGAIESSTPKFRHMTGT